MLDGERFQKIRNNEAPLVRAVIENHECWFEAVRDWPIVQELDASKSSSILYDTVAIYLAFAEEFLQMEELPILVTDDGKTLVDSEGSVVRCATDWRDKEAFLDLLVQRLSG